MESINALSYRHVLKVKLELHKSIRILILVLKECTTVFTVLTRKSRSTRTRINVECVHTSSTIFTHDGSTVVNVYNKKHLSLSSNSCVTNALYEEVFLIVYTGHLSIHNKYFDFKMLGVTLFGLYLYMNIRF